MELGNRFLGITRVVGTLAAVWSCLMTFTIMTENEPLKYYVLRSIPFLGATVIMYQVVKYLKYLYVYHELDEALSYDELAKDIDNAREFLKMKGLDI